MKSKIVMSTVFLGFYFLQAGGLPENEVMFCRSILFLSRSKCTESYSSEECALFEKAQLFEKLDGRSVLLTTVIRLVYWACSGSSPAEKEALLRVVLKPHCSGLEIEWAVNHMHVYVSRYGDDEKYALWL